MSLLSQSPSPRQSSAMLINKTLKLATQFELTIRNELRLIMVIAYKLFISKSIPWKFESFAGGGQTERKKKSFHKLDLRILMKPMG